MILSSVRSVSHARRALLVPLLLAPVCFSNAVAEVRSSRFNPALTDSLEAIVREASDRQRNVGLQLVIADRREIRFSMTLGDARLDPPLAVDESTRFQVASVTKAFTGVALLKLVEQGRFDLDAPIQKYVPEFPVNPEGEITSRLLAAHLAGIRSYGRTSATARSRASLRERAIDDRALRRGLARLEARAALRLHELQLQPACRGDGRRDRSGLRLASA